MTVFDVGEPVSFMANTVLQAKKTRSPKLRYP
jgi:hypothetical protein